MAPKSRSSSETAVPVAVVGLLADPHPRELPEGVPDLPALGAVQGLVHAGAGAASAPVALLTATAWTRLRSRRRALVRGTVRLAAGGALVTPAAAFGAPKRKASVVPMTLPAGLRWDQVILRVLADDLVEVVLGTPFVHSPFNRRTSASPR